MTLYTISILHQQQHNFAEIGLRAMSKSLPLKLGIILTNPTPGEISKWRSGGLQGMPRPDDHLLQSIGESKFLFNFFISNVKSNIVISTPPRPNNQEPLSPWKQDE